MLAHTIVYIVLSVLSLVAAYAIGTPLSKPPRDQQEPRDTDKEKGPADSLQ